jgi:hypothetical protein
VAHLIGASLGKIEAAKLYHRIIDKARDGSVFAFESAN